MSSSSHFPTSPSIFPAVELCSCRIERNGVLSCPEALTDSKSTTFAILVLTPGAMWAGVHPPTGTLAPTYTTSTARKTGPTDSTARDGSVRAENARRWPVRNASKRSSLNAHEPSTRTETKIIPCGIQRFIRFRKLASSASQPRRTWPNWLTTATAPGWRTMSKAWLVRAS